MRDLVSRVLGSDSFLNACRTSPKVAYEHFELLLAQLEDEDTRGEARALLLDLESAVQPLGLEEALERYRFAFEVFPASLENASQEPLRLLLFPSVFQPEHWSRTFFEGLARLPNSDFEGRTIAELGSGSGWISLSLARRALPEKVLGLDINPRAVTCGRLNVFHNGLDPDGQWIEDAEGRTLNQRVEFQVSDLLDWPRQQEMKLDIVIGCIPQVLSDKLDDIDAWSEDATDDFLFSLSNYTAPQGQLEDQFGLGLIARAIEESVGVLRGHGRVIFNLGGRPGKELLRRLFLRRGFSVSEVWSTRAAQALDTDISALAELEDRSAHRFELFLGPHDEESICARTAKAYQDSGAEIYHGISVFEGKIRFPEPLQRFYGWLTLAQRKAVADSLDLSFDDDSIAEEKTAFLSRLVDTLRRRDHFPYGDTAGQISLRGHFARYLQAYLGVSIAKDCLIVAPDRDDLLFNIWTLFEPRRTLIHPDLLPAHTELSCAREILECPTAVELACQLIATLKPEVVVTRIGELELRSPKFLHRLVEATGEQGARLFVDLSDALRFQSNPTVRGVFRALAEQPLPDHVAVLFHLDKDRVYEDLAITLLMSENCSLLEHLTSAADLTYSRTPMLVQEYFSVILKDLLAFRHLDEVTLRHPTPPSAQFDSVPNVVSHAREAFEHPALLVESWPKPKDTLRLDYGENSLQTPEFVKLSLLKAFARKAPPAAGPDLAAELSTLLQRRLGTGDWRCEGGSRFCFGLGVAPLFAALARLCAVESGTFVVPEGSYGHFVAALDFHGVQRESVPTLRSSHFKLEPEALDRALSTVTRPWLYLNAPLVNPTGSLYTQDEIRQLLTVASRHRARVVLDTIFSGLEFEDGIEPWDVDALSGRHVLDLVVLGGLSKELAGGGLRFGFAYSSHGRLIETMAGHVCTPHSTMLDAARMIYSRLNQPTAEDRSELRTQRKTLARHALRLANSLRATGWEPLEPRGGLFLTAKPRAYLGRQVSLATCSGERSWSLNAENLPEVLFRSTGILINSSRWTGLADHCRLVFAIPEAAIIEAERRLQDFADWVQDQ